MSVLSPTFADSPSPQTADIDAVPLEAASAETGPAASPPVESGSFASRAIAAFLHPQNIKWLLVAGVLILLASSLMLVSAHWHTTAPAWKYLILLGYAGGVGIAGKWCIGRLMLPRTGTVLMALCVLLMPVTFLGLNLVGRTGPPGVDGVPPIIWYGLLAVNAAIAAVSARGIFRHFFHRDQPTFLASYLLLAAAGAFIAAPATPIAAGLLTLALWAVFAAGAVKVNRHCFWLVEERRLPRIVGFFPIVLLGLQFLTLFLLGPAQELPLQWTGLGCALVAAVVLMTADAVAAVFQQRTGDLVRPIPWAITGPLITGLVLAGAGLCLSATGELSPYRPYALVPTAAVVTVLMALVARRTGRGAFVWAALIVATVAYNFSPVFFVDLARMVVAQGAAAVSERRLPLPFYGLTYLPLLAALLVIGGIARRTGNALIASPIRYYSFGLSVLLLGMSVLHAKAMFPVAAAMGLVLALHAKAFADRRPAWAAAIALVVAAAGLPFFLNYVCGLNLPLTSGVLIATTGIAGLMLCIAKPLDRLVAGFSTAESWARLPQYAWTATPCRHVSAALALILPAAWLVVAGTAAPSLVSWIAAGAIALLVVVHALIWLRPEISVMAVLFLQIAGLRAGALLGLTVADLLALVTAGLLIQWALGGLLLRHLPGSRISRAFADAMHATSRLELGLLVVGFYLPMVWTIAAGAADRLPVMAHPSLLLATILVVWGGDTARRAASPALAAVGCFLLFGTVAAIVARICGDGSWLLPSLTYTAVFLVVVGRWMSRRTGEWAMVAGVAARIAIVPLALSAVIAMFSYSLPHQVAGVISAVGLLLASRFEQMPRSLPWTAAAMLNWQAIALVLATCGPQPMAMLADITLAQLVAASVYVTAAAAGSLLAWSAVEHLADRFKIVANRSLPETHRAMLRLVTAAGLLVSLAIADRTAIDLSLAAFALATLIGTSLAAACRRQDDRLVWVAEGLLLAGVGYFIQAGVITFGTGWSVYLPIGAALLMQLAATLAARRPATQVLVRPFSQTALLLPLATVGIALLKHLIDPSTTWLGFSSLALLLSAGFYFWRGLERRQNGYHILAAAIVNISLMLLWRELRLNDPQFYLVPIGASVLLLVQLLHREIPRQYHDTLRYIGALLILVSPTFHIVGGSWLHLLSLMVLAVAVMLAGIGLRVRAMLYTGAAFLAADLVAMVVRGAIDQPSLLWLAGLAVGAGVITLAALAERHREHLLQRIRMLSAALAEWQ